MQELPILSIDYQKIRKNDVYTEEQVLHHYKYNLLGEEEYNKRVAKFHTKEYVSHPDEYSLLKVKEEEPTFLPPKSSTSLKTSRK